MFCVGTLIFFLGLKILLTSSLRGGVDINLHWVYSELSLLTVKMLELINGEKAVLP
jgi:hypothetical protein